MAVFVLHKGEHNYDKAKQYGELKYVTEGIVPIFKTDSLYSMLEKEFNDFDSHNDFVLLTGPVILCVLASIVLLRKVDDFKTLIFNAKAQAYTVRQIYK